MYACEYNFCISFLQFFHIYSCVKTVLSSYNYCKYRHPLLLISNTYLEICWTEHICMLCVCYIPFLNGTNAFLDHPKLSLKLLHISLKLTFFQNLVYKCIFGCVGSSLLCSVFLWLQWVASPSQLRCPGFSCCRARALGCVSSSYGVWVTLPQLMGSSWTGIAPMSPALAGGFFPTQPPGKSH